MTQNLLERCETCLLLHGDYERAREAVQQWILSAHQQFDIIEQRVNQSHEDLLRNRQLLKASNDHCLFVHWSHVTYSCELYLI